MRARFSPWLRLIGFSVIENCVDWGCLDGLGKQGCLGGSGKEYSWGERRDVGGTKGNNLGSL